MKIGIIGYGNLGWHLAHQFDELHLHEVHVLIRNNTCLSQESKNSKLNFISDMEEFRNNFDLIFLTVQDKFITPIAKKLTNIVSQNTILVHSSGAGNLHMLSPHEQNAVFWPLMSIKKESTVDWKNCPLFLTASSADSLHQLKNLAEQLSNDISILSDHERQYYHLAAVWSNNFSNLVTGIAYRQLQHQGLDPSKLIPILKHNLSRMRDSTPKELQTGPAVREDLVTIQHHLDMMEEDDISLYLKLSLKIAQEHNLNLRRFQDLIDPTLQ